MRHPTLQEEKKLWKKGYQRVAGLDESGRGPLAGPVVAAVVTINHVEDDPQRVRGGSSSTDSLMRLDIRDSKQLSAKQREKFYQLIVKDKNLEWGIGLVSEKVIDKINILEATKLAMARATAELKAKNEKRKIDFLILDGSFKINSLIPQKSIVKADEKVFSCSCASIIAKVTRDRMMLKYDKKYPCYGFAQNKGYPTEYHRKMLKKHGFCKIHRKTFRPVSRLTKI